MIFTNSFFPFFASSPVQLVCVELDFAHVADVVFNRTILFTEVHGSTKGLVSKCGFSVVPSAVSALSLSLYVHSLTLFMTAEATFGAGLVSQ